MADNNVGYRLTADIPNVFKRNISAHRLTYFDHTISCRIDAHIFNINF